MNLALSFIFSSLEYIAMLMLSLSAFRLQIRYSLHKIVLIAVIMTIVSMYIRVGLGLSSFAVLPTFVSEIVMIVILFRLPLLFSFLISLIGTLATATIELVFVSIEVATNLVTVEDLQNNNAYVQIPTIIVILLIMSFLLTRKIGFHFTMRDAIRGYNFYLSAILVIAVLLLQFELYSFERSLVHVLIPVISTVVFLLCIYLSYKHNQKLWKERRERLEKRK
ncbi:hypothetical protein PAESOLCIP111_02759 [Paenibacillus solanacearum]|uniref:Uncharacterized protein n=1 Tax=Paenibacillus solanacearum TaxID=2048548 RepID=A0A916NIV9_9BACL|nr:hypothetical protein PAESOLCIP111_02759 [Paenibacillus solanacearum]